PSKARDAIERIIAESLHFAAAIGELVQAPGGVVTPLFYAMGGGVAAVKWIGDAPFASDWIVVVGVLAAAAKEMRVLERVQQVSRTRWVIAVAGADILIRTEPRIRGRLLRHAVHGIEIVVSNHLAIRAVDLLRAAAGVVRDVGSLI